MVDKGHHRGLTEDKTPFFEKKADFQENWQAV